MEPCFSLIATYLVGNGIYASDITFSGEINSFLSIPQLFKLALNSNLTLNMLDFSDNTIPLLESKKSTINLS